MYKIKYSIVLDNLFLSYNGVIYQFGLKGTTQSDDLPD